MGKDDAKRFSRTSLSYVPPSPRQRCPVVDSVGEALVRCAAVPDCLPL